MDPLVLRSSIRPSLKHSLLQRGTFLGFIGGLLFLLAGIFLPLPQLSIWGLPVLGAAFALITAGLLPYRRLSHLEMHPHEISLTEQRLRFSRSGKPSFTLPLSCIKRIDYRDAPRHYGIAIWLKNPLPAKEGCDIFLPYFSKRSFDEMKEFYF
jgi:hypothetical protein